MSARKIVLFTDIGRDIDDLLALIFLLAHPEVEIAAIVTSFGNTRARREIVLTVLNWCNSKVPVFAGQDIDVLPIEESVNVLIICPCTDAARLLPSLTVNRIFIMGDPTDGISSFNIDTDSSAHIAICARHQPIYVSKFLAYELAIPAEWFATLQNGSDMARFVYREAKGGLERFSRDHPDVFKRVFNVDSIPDKMDDLPLWSFPYDVTVMLLLVHPELFAVPTRIPLVYGTKAEVGACRIGEMRTTIMAGLNRMLNPERFGDAEC